MSGVEEGIMGAMRRTAQQREDIEVSPESIENETADAKTDSKASDSDAEANSEPDTIEAAELSSKQQNDGEPTDAAEAKETAAESKDAKDGNDGNDGKDGNVAKQELPPLPVEVADRFRMSVLYNQRKRCYQVKVPAYGDFVIDGETRAAALAKAELELPLYLDSRVTADKPLLQPIDEEDFSGEIDLKVSNTLHRELAAAAREENQDFGRFVSELVAFALGHRQGRFNGNSNRQSNNNNNNNRPANRNNQNNNNGAGRGRGRSQQGNHTNLMDDNASWMEYLRNTEKGGTGGGRGGAGGGGGRRNTGGGGNGGGGGRGRR